MKITGQLVLDLRPADPDDWHDCTPVSRAWEIACAPAGADVVVIVSRRQFLDPEITRRLRSDGAHVGTITVQSDDPDTIRRWIDALRGVDVYGIAS